MDETILIGRRTAFSGDAAFFGVKTIDRRQHVYVIGKTGSGKTTLLRNLLVQHIEAGHGVGLIDPHGDLAEEILNYIPSARADDVVYFNPADLEYPIGLNLLANVPKDERHLVASGVVSALKNLWRDSWGPRLEYILYNSLAALLDCKNVTLLGVTRMLTDANYRQWVIRQVKDPFIKSFWTEEFEKYDPRFLREAIAPIQNKVGQFLMSPPIRNILGQVKSKVDFRFIMDDQRIFVANLSKGKLGEDKANLLGSLLTTQFQLAAMQRANTPEAKRQDFFLLIDEFQNFSTTSFATILSEARKYRLCLTLSHQYIAQLSEEMRAAVFGNVGTLISFRVGYDDAEVLAGQFGKVYLPSQFSDLDKHQILVKLLVDGSAPDPFHAMTFPPLGTRHDASESFIQNCRVRFSVKRAEIEKRLSRWMEE